MRQDNNTVIRLAGCVLLNGDKMLLLHRNKNGKVQWETPGGKVELGESDEAAAKRELKEELGVNVNIIRKIGEGGFEERGQWYHYVWFLAEVSDTCQSFNLESGFDESKYMSVPELRANQQGLSLGTKKLLELYVFENN